MCVCYFTSCIRIVIFPTEFNLLVKVSNIYSSYCSKLLLWVILIKLSRFILVDICRVYLFPSLYFKRSLCLCFRHVSYKELITGFSFFIGLFCYIYDWFCCCCFYLENVIHSHLMWVLMYLDPFQTCYFTIKYSLEYCFSNLLRL